LRVHTKRWRKKIKKIESKIVLLEYIVYCTLYTQTVQSEESVVDDFVRRDPNVPVVTWLFNRSILNND